VELAIYASSYLKSEYLAEFHMIHFVHSAWTPREPTDYLITNERDASKLQIRVIGLPKDLASFPTIMTAASAPLTKKFY